MQRCRIGLFHGVFETFSLDFIQKTGHWVFSGKAHPKLPFQANLRTYFSTAGKNPNFPPRSFRRIGDFTDII